MAAQWLTHHTFTARGMGLIPDQGAKILYAAQLPHPKKQKTKQLHKLGNHSENKKELLENRIAEEIFNRKPKKNLPESVKQRQMKKRMYSACILVRSLKNII